VSVLDAWRAPQHPPEETVTSNAGGLVQIQ
jgi:hypothetical protein